LPWPQVWRRGVIARKTSHAREVLTKQSFLLNPVFRAALLRVRGACESLSSLRLHTLSPGEVVSLEDLATAQSKHSEVVSSALADFHKNTVQTARVGPGS
jgi:hypothetical protein